MRYDNVVRFLAVLFVIGAAVGLAGGLLFGGAGKPTSGAKTPASASTTTTQALAGPMSPERAQEIGANELGEVMVLMYHLIATPEPRYTRSPEHLRQDIELLKAEGYYPVNVRDLVDGNVDVPAGKTPVVLTFDDSSIGQYRVLNDGSVDPDSAVGILQDEVKKGGWASRASFYCLLDVDVAERILFGQKELQKQKLTNLVSWGYEVGSHTVTHLDLKKASSTETRKQLAQSKSQLEKLIGNNYAVKTLAVPFGDYPSSDAILASGTWEDMSYQYTAALAVAGGPSPSPYSTHFKALHIPRIEVAGNNVREWVDYFKQHPELRYVSDGDATAVSAPKQLVEQLGTPLKDLGRALIQY